MNLVLTNIFKMQFQAISMLLLTALTTLSNLLLQVPTESFDLNELVGYGGMAVLAFATWLFRKMKIEVDAQINVSNKEDDDDKGSER